MWNGCPLYSQFDFDLPLWRYMPLYKFEDLIKTSSLFFTRADHLTKKFDDAEGAMTASEKDLIDRVLVEVHNLLLNQPTPIRSVSGIPFAGSQHIDVEAYRANVERVYAYYLNHMYINCWHQNWNEEVLMWKDYVPDSNGVVIRTTSKGLINSLQATAEDVFASTVEYIDHGEEEITDALRRGGGLYLVLLQMLIRKKLRFSGEREFRLLTCQLPVSELYGSVLRNDLSFENMDVENGKLLKINFTELHAKVILHPNAPAKLHGHVLTLLDFAAHDYGLSNVNVESSTIPAGTF